MFDDLEVWWIFITQSHNFLEMTDFVISSVRHLKQRKMIKGKIIMNRSHKKELHHPEQAFLKLILFLSFHCKMALDET